MWKTHGFPRKTHGFPGKWSTFIRPFRPTNGWADSRWIKPMAWTSKSLVNGYSIQSIPQNMVFIWYLWVFFWMIPSSWKTVLFRPKTIWDSADPAGIAPKSEGLLWSPDTNPSVCGFPGRNPETRQAGNLTINGWVLGENLQETMIFTPKLFGVSCRFSLHPESIDWDEKIHWCTKKQSEHA